MAEPLEIAIELGQKCLQSNPAIVLGSGCSAPHGIPTMPKLRDELVGKLDASDLKIEDQEALERLKDELTHTDLEDALHKVNVGEVLVDRIVQITWDFIEPADRMVLEAIVLKREYLPLSRLLLHLFQSTQTRISIVTPNYDRLAEYAADAVNLHHSTGFGFGYIQSRQNAQVQLYSANKAVPVRTVEIWKVHGSLDWFSDPDENVMGIPTRLKDMSSLKPVIVTPGVNKYQKALQEPFRSILTGADQTLRSAQSYLCIGYGFRDNHIQPKLIEKCNKTRTLLVVLARNLTEEAKQFLLSGKCQHFLALEQHPDGTLMYRDDEKIGTVIQGEELWSLDRFLKATT